LKTDNLLKEIAMRPRHYENDWPQPVAFAGMVLVALILIGFVLWI
jgi:hypothetical protein